MARLKDFYKADVAPALMKKYEYKSVMQIPKIDKIVIFVDLYTKAAFFTHNALTVDAQGMLVLAIGTFVKYLINSEGVGLLSYVCISCLFVVCEIVIAYLFKKLLINFEKRNWDYIQKTSKTIILWSLISTSVLNIYSINIPLIMK